MRELHNLKAAETKGIAGGGVLALHAIMVEFAHLILVDLSHRHFRVWACEPISARNTVSDPSPYEFLSY